MKAKDIIRTAAKKRGRLDLAPVTTSPDEVKRALKKVLAPLPRFGDLDNRNPLAGPVVTECLRIVANDGWSFAAVEAEPDAMAFYGWLLTPQGEPLKDSLGAWQIRVVPGERPQIMSRTALTRIRDTKVAEKIPVFRLHSAAMSHLQPNNSLTQ